MPCHSKVCLKIGSDDHWRLCPQWKIYNRANVTYFCLERYCDRVFVRITRLLLSSKLSDSAYHVSRIVNVVEMCS